MAEGRGEDRGAGAGDGEGGSTPVPPPENKGAGLEVSQVGIEDEMRSAYLDYAMSVIIGRAIPDIRDGLKPVHRRILFAMHEGKLLHNQPYRKSARVVGDVIGKYHPHGDAAVYDAIVRMAQDFSMRALLVDGQGNFGSLDGDPPAAMRYTEVRLKSLAEAMLEDLEKETVEWGPNYDESLLEPLVMPTRFPNLLVNGSGGIAVGMATNIPPHNLGEIIDATVALIKDPDLGFEDLLQIVPGPDFPTGGTILGQSAIRQAYLTGRGVLALRAKAFIEEDEKKHRNRIVVTEVPYQTNKAKILEKIAELVREKRITEISDIRDESSREGVRMVVDLKKDAVAQVVLNQLYKMTPLHSSFGIINLAIAGGRPRVLGLKEMLEQFIAFRAETVTRRSRFELRKAEERLHVLEGLKIAIDNIDEVVSIIRKAKSPSEAGEKLEKRFGLSEIQSKAILDMRLARLTGLERDKILEEMAGLERIVAELMSILSDRAKLMQVIVKELLAIKEAFADERRTVISAEESDFIDEDLIAVEEMVVTVTHCGYLKRTQLAQYRSQGRGGKGVTAMETREDDFVQQLYVASTHASLLFFSDRGKVYSKRVFEVPLAGRTSKGKAVVNFVGMEPGERVTAILPVAKFAEGRYIVTATRKGLVKKTDLMLYSNIRATGIIGVLIEEGDSLVGARLTDGEQDLLLCTLGGYCIRFPESQVRPMGRGTRGVAGIGLREGDEVVSMTAVAGGEAASASALLTVCVNGYGKRTDLSEFRGQRRGGKGIIAIKTSERNGKVVGSLFVSDEDEIMLVTAGGTIIRIPAGGISIQGRATQGVRLIKVGENETVASVEALHAEEMVGMANGDEPVAGGEVEGVAARAAPGCEDMAGAAEEGEAGAEERPGKDGGDQEDRDTLVDEDDSGWEKAIAGEDDEN